jgi:HD-like signal output (HDOD) protein
MNVVMSIMPHLDEQEIRYRVSRINDLPLFHGSLPRIAEIVNDEVFSSKDIESLLRYDQVLSARVLRLANSSYCGHRGTVRTLSRAIDVIGFDQVKTLCLSAMLIGMCSGDSSLSLEVREQVWKHGYATARAAGELARRRPWINEEEAYTLGLIHDLGWIVMATCFADYYRHLQELARSRNLLPWNLESQYSLTHSRIGKWIAIKWAFPEVFQRVMEFHHTPEHSPAFKPEVRMVYLANLLANGKEHPGLPVDEITAGCRRELCITDEEWHACRKRLDQVWLEVDQLWNLLK